MVAFDLSVFFVLRFGGGWGPRLRAIFFAFFVWGWVLGWRVEGGGVGGGLGIMPLGRRWFLWGASGDLKEWVAEVRAVFHFARRLFWKTAFFQKNVLGFYFEACFMEF